MTEAELIESWALFLANSGLNVCNVLFSDKRNPCFELKQAEC